MRGRRKIPRSRLRFARYSRSAGSFMGLLIADRIFNFDHQLMGWHIKRTRNLE